MKVVRENRYRHDGRGPVTEVQDKEHLVVLRRLVETLGILVKKKWSREQHIPFIMYLLNTYAGTYV